MRRKTCLLFFITSCFAVAANSQDNAVPTLTQINSDLKNPYIKVEQLDKIQHDLNYFDEHPVSGNEEKLMLFDAYQTLANGYSANNHFKQGYSVYQKYLLMKEKTLAHEKADAIASLVKEMDNKQSKEENDLMDRKNDIHQLQLDNKQLESKRKSFKQYFSFGVITLTLVFSFLLLQAGIKMNKIKHDLKAGRERLKAIHRISAFGRLKNGIAIYFRQTFSAIKKTTESSVALAEQLPSVPGKKNDDLTALKKRLTEIINSI